MKKVLGLDLGTTSIGWALVHEGEGKEESEIVKLGVRIVPLSADEIRTFGDGRPQSTNIKRRLSRSMRRNRARYKQRRLYLDDLLTKNGLISKDSILYENGKGTTFQALQIRAKAATEKISLEEIAIVLRAINKKRGYKSNRKVKSEEDGEEIDGMEIAKLLYNDGITPGLYVYEQLQKGNTFVPNFYRSDLSNELKRIWDTQKNHYPNILTDSLLDSISGKSKKATWAILKSPFQIKGINIAGNRNEKKLRFYELRSIALNEKIDLEYLAIVLQEINGSISTSSDYLGAIGDRSKQLFIKNITVGQFLYNQIEIDKHARIKNQVFYRQDYLDEFEKIWETQAKFHQVLTPMLKSKIRDEVIFYQRKLKSQKGLISFCEFEKKSVVRLIDGKSKEIQIGPRVAPKSSPVFQEFKIWQGINNLNLVSKETGEVVGLSARERSLLFEELNLRGNLKETEFLKILGKKKKDWETNNINELEGNTTNHRLFKAFQKIVEINGYEVKWDKKSSIEIKNELKKIFIELGIESDILFFDNKLVLDSQPSYQFWHMLYSAEDDNLTKITEIDRKMYGSSDVNLRKKLHTKFGFSPNQTKYISNISFEQDYGSICAKAMRKMLPYLQEGKLYSEAASLAGYNHSNSLTKSENLKRVLTNKLEPINAKELRNPVVTKILNQLVHVVNQIIEKYGTLDEIRVEMARDLKKSAKQRKEITRAIKDATQQNTKTKELLRKTPFNIQNPTRNDVIKYKLYEELSGIGFHSIYSGKYIPKEILFSSQIEIEHIIPQARLFDDSFSNKTLSFHKVNQEKSNSTAFDYMQSKSKEKQQEYLERINQLLSLGKISRAKHRKLMMSIEDIPKDFLNRDLGNTQYIAKKAKSILETICLNVQVTTGKITDELRRDWGLINVMKELNLPKYRNIEGMVYHEIRKDGKSVEKIKDWSKRNDHRHHAMDALTVAFTTISHVQYLNNKNAGNDETHILNGIKNKITTYGKDHDGSKRRLFVPPMVNFRQKAKQHLENVFISFKAKNKVVTNRKNKIKGHKNPKVELTPRGQLHEETIYKKYKKEVVESKKIGTKFNQSLVDSVTRNDFRKLLQERLDKFGDPKKAFAGKNSLSNNPIILPNGNKIPLTVQVKYYKDGFSIRKPITGDLNVDKVIDHKIKNILKDRIAKFNGNKKKAFANLEEDPIWQNKDKGIAIKSVTIDGIKNGDPIHQKRNQKGDLLKSENLPVDYVSYGNNHHATVFQDEKGKLHEDMVPFALAVARAVSGVGIVQKIHPLNPEWEFKYTILKNEMWIFPSEEFNPHDIDLKNVKHARQISKHLYRVQKLAPSDYNFIHHLAADSEMTPSLKTLQVIRIQSRDIGNAIKVRINHIGEIVHIYK